MPHQNPHHARRWAILAVLGIAQLMVVLDATIVNIALPSAQHALGFSNDIAPVGRHRLRARLRLACCCSAAASATSSAASAPSSPACSASPSLPRSAAPPRASACSSAPAPLQGAFGALLAPAALSLLTTTFTDPTERAKAFGIFGAIAGGGAAVGLLLGGMLTEYLSWRWCLYVNLLFAIPAAVAAYSLLHNQSSRSTARAWTSPARSPPRPACSRSSTASRTPRPRAGATR